MTQNEFLGVLGRKYLSDPVFFTEHALGVYTWSKMREIMESVRDNKYTAVRACHGSSKTFTAAIIAIWFFNMFLNSKVITTAPTGPQVELLLWTEIGKLYRTSRIELEGECLIKAIKDRERSEHLAVGFSTDKAERAEGWHAPEILFILDEAKGIEQWMWDSMAGALGGGHCRALAISTTDGVNAGEKFHSIFTDPRVGAKWNKIHIDVLDLPTFTNEPLIIRDYKTGDRIEKQIKDLNIQISTPEWEKERKDEWGGDSVLYLTKCRGQITDETPDSIIKLSQVMKMFDNYNNPNFDDTGAVEYGVDVARFGDDSSVFYGRKGLKTIGKEKHNKRDLEYLADRLEEFVEYKKLSTECKIKIDDTGVGGGLVDIMRRRGYQNIIAVNFGQVAQEPDKYPNAISEMWFELASMIDQIASPNDEVLKAELVNRKQKKLDIKGRRVVEPKDDYKKRFSGKSPDHGDAFLLCYYNMSCGPVAYMVEHDVY